MTPEEKRLERRKKQIIWREQNPEKVKQQAINRRKGKIIVADKLLENLDDVQLNEDQLIYLYSHLTEKRTKLAKKLGIQKIKLNHMLDIMGRETNA